jgi:hypothetical protein
MTGPRSHAALVRWAMRISQGRLCHYPTILDIDTASDQLGRTNRRMDVRDISCDARIAERRRCQEHSRGRIFKSVPFAC